MFLKRFSQELFPAAFVTAFSASILSHSQVGLVVLKGWWSSMHPFLGRTLTQCIRENVNFRGKNKFFHVCRSTLNAKMHVRCLKSVVAWYAQNCVAPHGNLVVVDVIALFVCVFFCPCVFLYLRFCVFFVFLFVWYV